MVRAREGLPPSPARLWGAPVTTGLAFLFLAAVLVSTAFIDGLTIAWKAGLPFFALLLVAYAVVARRGHTEHNDPLREELAARQRASDRQSGSQRRSEPEPAAEPDPVPEPGG